MDKELRALLDQATCAGTDDLRVDVDEVDPDRITIDLPQGPRSFTLKPLDQLYESTPDVGSIDPQDQHYEVLLLAIEGQIADFYRDNPGLTDGQVMLALKPLSMNPAAPCGKDPLGGRIQHSLRVCLTVNSYSQQEVKLALRKVIKSVERHTRESGRQGYVSFIAEFC